MEKLTAIVEKLSLFNNITLTKKQWEITLKGCGCPKSTHLWTVLRKNNLQKNKLMYTLVNINEATFSSIYQEYTERNRAGAIKSYNKTKARAKARESINKNKGTTFYLVGGILTTEKPERE